MSQTRARSCGLVGQFVYQELLAKCEAQPSSLNRTYYHTAEDVRCHVHAAKVRQQLSKLDQEQMVLRSRQWTKEHPTSRFFFRPFVPGDKKNSYPSSKPDTNVVSSSIGTAVPSSVFAGNCADDIKPTTNMLETADFEQPLLWVCD